MPRYILISRVMRQVTIIVFIISFIVLFILFVLFLFYVKTRWNLEIFIDRIELQ